MKSIAHRTTLAVALSLFLVGATAALPAQTESRPPSSGSVPDDLAETTQRAVEILVALQESLDAKGVGDEWPYEGVYRVAGDIPIGYRVGGTAICAWALIETPQYAGTAKVRDAVERGLDFALDTLDHDRMKSGFSGGYDVRGWGHTYALTFLLRLREKELVPEQRARAVDEKIAWLVRTLEETEISGGGGWNYSRRRGTEAASPASPFMTAPTLMALYTAAKQGEQVDAEVVERALDTLEKSRNAIGAFPYTTAGGRDEMPGAIGRTPAAEVALYLAGRSEPARIRHALDGFLEHWQWLEKRRRQTGTHVPPYGIAPYYFYFAHYYAALAIEFLPPEERSEYRVRFLERLFQVQEPSGGWNDRVFPRSENYGTAMSLLALLQPTLPKPPHWSSVSPPSPQAPPADQGPGQGHRTGGQEELKGSRGPAQAYRAVTESCRVRRALVLSLPDVAD